MKTHTHSSSSIAALVGLAATLTISSCTLPPSEAWHQIKQEGLIAFLSTPYPARTLAPIAPVTEERNTTPSNVAPADVAITPEKPVIATNRERFVGPPGPAATETVTPDLASAHTPEPVATSNNIVTPAPVKPSVNIMPAPDKAQLATSVPSLPGFVRSPYTIPPRLVDVKGAAPGATMVCPYTHRVFIVPSDFVSQPDTTLVTSTATATTKVMAQPPVIAVKNNIPNTTPPVAKTNPPVLEQKNTLPSTTTPEPTTPPANALFKNKPVNNTPAKTNIASTVKSAAPELPYGMPIPNRPGFVNSPYAAKHQLVDVTGLPIGMEVKCPYTGKLFKVPASDIAEQKTLASPSAPPAPEKAEKK
ncbi:MAG: hypothetical protein K8R87_03620 [Verrucomicrobia bacterium]|nr:hypothetical protein [Verrucomicrobiota bacterium]